MNKIKWRIKWECQANERIEEKRILGLECGRGGTEKEKRKSVNKK